MLTLLCALMSLAGGNYHPPEIAAKSKVYTKAAESAGQAFRDRSSDVEVMAAALVEYREALDLLGSRAPQAELDRLAAMQKQFNRDRAVLEAFANTMMQDFDDEFSAALSRSLPADAVSCRSQIPTGPALPGIPSPMEENPDCTGENLNTSLAAKLDADAALSAAVTEIIALEWPTVRPEPVAQAPIGSAERWVSVQPWFRALIGSALKKVDAADESERLEFYAALENKPSPEQMKDMLGSARALTKRTASTRATLARPTLAAIDTWNAKKAKKNLDFSWCANPEILGGCTGTDATGEVGKVAATDKRVVKSTR